MLIRLVYEEEEVAKLKDSIKKLSTKQLYFLQNFLEKELLQRKKAVYHEWLEALNQCVATNEKKE